MTNFQKPIAFSGIQPSGIIHLGNYLGSIKNWLGLQEHYQCIFCLVDYHAITVRQKPEELRKNTEDLLKLYLACGVDPARSIIFIQSRVPAHTELAWILNTVAYIGELKRMTQFKDKADQHKGNANVGLFDYPVLMAADILLYQTNIVPVGQDQLQHVELTRTLARRFNQTYGETFTVPEPLIGKGAKIMGLDDPAKKMSKSAKNLASYIALTDDAETVRKKIAKAVTDSGREIKLTSEKPAISNLLVIYHLLSGVSIKDLEKKYADKGYAEFKKDLAEAIIGFLKPIQEKIKTLDQTTINQIIEDGVKQAQTLSQLTLSRVKEKMGLL